MPETAGLQDITKRLETLERDNRRMKVGGASVLAVAVALSCSWDEPKNKRHSNGRGGALRAS
jgi:hypothetical protein